MTNSYSLYWIHLHRHKDIFTDGYVGITKDVNRRFCEHKRAKRRSKLKIEIDFHGWDNLVKDVIITDLSEEEAILLEEMYRPTDHIGWNIVKGGKTNYFTR